MFVNPLNLGSHLIRSAVLYTYEVPKIGKQSTNKKISTNRAIATCSCVDAVGTIFFFI